MTWLRNPQQYKMGQIQMLFCVRHTTLLIEKRGFDVPAAQQGEQHAAPAAATTAV